MTTPRRRVRTAPTGTVVAYTRVSTEEQAASGAGLDAQRAAIEFEAQRRGWTIVTTHTDEGISGSKDVAQRPGLGYALDLIESGHASILLVAKTDRLARGLRTLLDVIDRVERAGGAVVSVDGTIDTSTAAGRFQTQVMGGVAELERALISDRTKAALAIKKAQGVRLGRPSQISAEVVERILDARERGDSLRTIAADLTADAVPTARGGTRWSPATIQTVLKGQDAERLRAVSA